MRVIGTAGHVDHGKSTLVQALTGINPDRLREEQERQMTIDLGFAWMKLPGGEEIGIVDVPGHRDFIENMLAGVGGIDAGLLVVAADEGVMPQTREHLAILDLLQVRRAVIALAKTDLVEDDSWLQLVREEVSQLLEGSSLAGSPIVPVSAITGYGLEQLQASLAQVLAGAEARRNLGRPRLPIDRAFSMAGFGTVVTGTLIDGTLQVGEEVEILPGRLRARIRGLQTHKLPVQQAVPGSRVAANLSGIEVRGVARGDVLVHPGDDAATRRIDVRFRLLPTATGSLRHNRHAKLFLGSAQRMARVRLLGAQELRPGEIGWLQLEMDEPLVARRGDHFILRRASPSDTLGGGSVADAHPPKRHRRFDARVLDHLEGLLSGEPGEVLEATLASLGPVPWSEAVQSSGLDQATAEDALEALRHRGALRVIGGSGDPSHAEPWAVAERSWAELAETAREILAGYHQANPTRLGMPREELKHRLADRKRWNPALLDELIRAGVVEQDGTRLRLPEFQVQLDPAQRQSVVALMERFASRPFLTPSWKECLQAVGEQLLAYLLEAGLLIRLSQDVLMEAGAYREMVERIRQALERQGTISVAEVRDLFGTSRKYALAWMEHLDAVGITHRQGDVRRLKKPAG